MTQKATVLKMLRDAGKRGVRSDEFIRNYLPRGCARVYDLRKEGYEIRAERQGKYTRFWLVGVGGESGAARDVDAAALGHSSDSGDSPETHDAGTPSLEPVSIALGSGEDPTLFATPERRPLSAFTDSEAA